MCSFPPSRSEACWLRHPSTCKGGGRVIKEELRRQTKFAEPQFRSLVRAGYASSYFLLTSATDHAGWIIRKLVLGGAISRVWGRRAGRASTLQAQAQTGRKKTLPRSFFHWPRMRPLSSLPTLQHTAAQLGLRPYCNSFALQAAWGGGGGGGERETHPCHCPDPVVYISSRTEYCNSTGRLSHPSGLASCP